MPPILQAKLTSDAILTLQWALGEGFSMKFPQGLSEDAQEHKAAALAADLNSAAEDAMRVLTARGFTRDDIRERVENAAATRDALDDACEEFKRGLLK